VSEAPAPPRGLRYSRRGFLRRGAFAALVKFSGLFIVFGLQVLLARLIGDTAEYGKYAWGQSLMFLVGIVACVGVPLAASRFVASLEAQHDQRGAREIGHRAQRILLFSGAVPLTAGILLALFWRDPGGTSAYRDVAVVALLFAPASTFATLFRDLARGRQWLGLALLPMQVLRPLCTATLAITCWWLLGGDLSGPATLALVGCSLVAVFLPQAFIYYRRQAAIPVDPAAPPTPGEYRGARLLPTALPLFVTRCAGLVITYSNVLLVGFLAGPAAAGAYFAAERLAQLARIPKTVVSMVNQQSMAAAHATGRREDLQLLATQSAHGSLWPTLALGLGLVLFAVQLLGMFGPDFAAARDVLVILVAGGIIAVFTGPAHDLMVMTGRQKLIPRIMVFAATTHVTALFLLVPSHGALGAAVATVISTLLGQGWLMVLARREIGVSTTVLHSLARSG